MEEFGLKGPLEACGWQGRLPPEQLAQSPALFFRELIFPRLFPLSGMINGVTFPGLVVIDGS